MRERWGEAGPQRGRRRRARCTFVIARSDASLGIVIIFDARNCVKKDLFSFCVIVVRGV